MLGEIGFISTFICPITLRPFFILTYVFQQLLLFFNKSFEFMFYPVRKCQ
uniref:Uncharacterized protein n=1 Tax=Rhizophora mucronata TaxID=61149 RepID=A0A2P2NYU8_RHIMU